MLKKTMLAAMVVAAVAAVAAPTMATAQNWTHHEESLVRNEQVHLTANLKYQSGILGSVECQTTTLLQLKVGQSTGTVDEYDVDIDEPGSTVTTKCKASGFLNPCQVHTAQPTNLPWLIHNKTNYAKITYGEIHLTMAGSFCNAKRAVITAASKAHPLIATPNQPKTVTSFTLSGEVIVHLYDQHEGTVPHLTRTVLVQGTQTITEEDKHTYSLE